MKSGKNKAKQDRPNDMLINLNGAYQINNKIDDRTSKL